VQRVAEGVSGCKKKKSRFESRYVVTLGMIAAVSVVARLTLEPDVVLQRNCLSDETPSEGPDATTTSTLLFVEDDGEDVA